jgi:hypothetical protein
MGPLVTGRVWNPGCPVPGVCSRRSDWEPTENGEREEAPNWRLHRGLTSLWGMVCWWSGANPKRKAIIRGLARNG